MSINTQQIKTWGPKPVIFLAGIAGLIWLSGTAVAPVVTAFLVAVVVYWGLQAVS